MMKQSREDHQCTRPRSDYAPPTIEALGTAQEAAASIQSIHTGF